jgi:hypothetical protein
VGMHLELKGSEAESGDDDHRFTYHAGTHGHFWGIGIRSDVILFTASVGRNAFGRRLWAVVPLRVNYFGEGEQAGGLTVPTWAGGSATVDPSVPQPGGTLHLGNFRLTLAEFESNFGPYCVRSRDLCARLLALLMRKRAALQGPRVGVGFGLRTVQYESRSKKRDGDDDGGASRKFPSPPPTRQRKKRKN